MNDAENRFINALHQFGIDNALKQIEKIKKEQEEEMSDDAFIEALRDMANDEDIDEKISYMSPEEKEIDSCKINVRVDGFLLDVQKEFERASKKHKKFSSHHEGLAVIWEEFEELKEEIFKKVPDQDNLYDELTQIAAMCLKFYRNLMED